MKYHLFSLNVFPFLQDNVHGQQTVLLTSLQQEMQATNQKIQVCLKISLKLYYVTICMLFLLFRAVYSVLLVNIVK